jgi:hypothetical protein
MTCLNTAEWLISLPTQLIGNGSNRIEQMAIDH